MNIAHVLQRHARERPSQPAIIDGPAHAQRILTFAQLDEQVGCFAALLKALGARAGDHALIFQPMSAELYVILLALFRLGAVAVFIDPSQGRAHIERCCARIPPKIFIAAGKAHLLRLISRPLRRIPIKVSVGPWLPATVNYGRLFRQQACTEILDCNPDAPALVTFTSGSTGVPKAAVRSHGFLLAQHRVLAANLHHVAGEVDLATLPIFVLANLASAVTSVIADVDLRRPGAIDAAKLLRHIRQQPALRSAASPAFYQRLAEYCRQQGMTLNNFTRIDTGGAPVFPDVLAQLHAIAPNAEIVAVYGSTEAEPIAHIYWRDISRADRDRMLQGKGLLAGPPVAEINCKVIRDRFGTAIGPFSADTFAQQYCATDEVGEIVVAGEHVLPGYLDGVGDAETKFEVDGRRWHRTGDLGCFDAHGRLWLLGRCTARIEDANGVCFPFAVETVARSDARIRHAAMVAWRGRRVLVVEYRPGAQGDDDELRQHIAWAKLAAVVSVRTMPLDKRHNAKIDYPALMALLDRTQTMRTSQGDS